MTVFRVSVCLTCGEWGQAMGTGEELHPLRTEHQTDSGKIVSLYEGTSHFTFTNLENYISKLKPEDLIKFAKKHDDIQTAIHQETQKIIRNIALIKGKTK